MKKILLFSILLFNIGCFFKDNRKIIHYKYGGVTITRVNDYPKDIFYYGDFNTLDNLPEKYILSKFSGIDGLMNAFLIFNKNGTVEIRPVADDFEKIGTSSKLILNDTLENIDFIHWRDSTKLNLDNIVEVCDVIKIEQERNLIQNSRVEVIYDPIEQK